MPFRPDNELRALSEHVLYEVQVLFRTAARLERYATVLYTPGELSEDEAIRRGFEIPWLERMVLLEGFAIHARGLTDFVFRDRTPNMRRTDVLAADFFEPGEWSATRPTMEATLDLVPQRVGREIAHITTHRADLTTEMRRWPFAQIAASIGRPLRVFTDALPTERAIRGFRDKVWAEFPDYLRAPAAMSHPPDWWPPSLATQMASPGAAD